MISQSKHATAVYPVNLPSPDSMYIFLNILKQEMALGSRAPLLASLPRTAGATEEWRSITSPQYKTVNSNLNRIDELFFRFQTEKGDGYKSLTQLTMTLHFVIY